MVDDAKQRRNYFRLEYYPPNQPLFKANGKDFTVVDLSERGIKFDLPKGVRPRLGATVEGDVIFKDGSKHTIKGQVVRVDVEKNTCSLSLEDGIPLAKMLEEQRKLINKYS